MCAGDSHACYGLPNATYDHIESVYGLWSNHSLTDPQVYPDDVLVHTSGYAPDGTKNLGYYRRFDSLVDTTAMNGNCSAAVPEWKKNEMYPCVELNYSYGYALTGLTKPAGLRVVLEMSAIEEPNIRAGEPAVYLYGKITCLGTISGQKYGIYRFRNGNVGVPEDVASYEMVTEYPVFYFVGDSSS